jgi:YkoY family integral membrane protein
MVFVMGDFMHQARDAAPAIALLVLMEGLLSVDNILAVASLASNLPEAQRKKALRLGLLGAYVFRGLALLFATIIVESHTMMILGALYLIHLMAEHFCEAEDGANAELHMPHTFWGTVVAIQFLDLSLSLDNVIVAVGVAPGQIWIVYTGVFIGLLTLWLFATLSLRLIEKHPVLKHAAFLLIGLVGVMLLVEIAAHIEIQRWQKFIGSVAVIAACLGYARSVRGQEICRPVFAVLMLPLRAYAHVVGGALGAVASGVKWTAGRFRGRK